MGSDATEGLGSDCREGYWGSDPGGRVGSDSVKAGWSDPRGRVGSDPRGRVEVEPQGKASWGRTPESQAPGEGERPGAMNRERSAPQGGTNPPLFSTKLQCQSRVRYQSGVRDSQPKPGPDTGAEGTKPAADTLPRLRLTETAERRGVSPLVEKIHIT